MFSVPDIMVVSVLALLLFGPDRLPKLMRQAGRFMREVQNTSQGFISEMERAADLAEHPPSASYVPPTPAATYGDAAAEDLPDYHEAAAEPHVTQASVAEPPVTEAPAVEHATAAVNEHAEPSSNEHSALRNPPLGGSAF
jgi:TatA/E family protein of Tat protein translocase